MQLINMLVLTVTQPQYTLIFKMMGLQERMNRLQRQGFTNHEIDRIRELKVGVGVNLSGEM